MAAEIPETEETSPLRRSEVALAEAKAAMRKCVELGIIEAPDKKSE